MARIYTTEQKQITSTFKNNYKQYLPLNTKENKTMSNKTNLSSKNKDLKQPNYKKVGIVLGVSLSAALASIILPEIAIAAKFDIDAGVKAATDPVIKGIGDHWGKAVAITGTAGAVVGEGDARQRATRAAFAAVAAGGVVLALLAMLT
jgi:hypothetical protein